jgi:hypothetical protein
MIDDRRVDYSGGSCFKENKHPTPKFQNVFSDDRAPQYHNKYTLRVILRWGVWTPLKRGPLASRLVGVSLQYNIILLQEYQMLSSTGHTASTADTKVD